MVLATIGSSVGSSLRDFLGVLEVFEEAERFFSAVASFLVGVVVDIALGMAVCSEQKWEVRLPKVLLRCWT